MTFPLRPRIAFITLVCAIAASLLYAAPARGDDGDDDDAPEAAGNACLTLDQPGATDALDELRNLSPKLARLEEVRLAGLSTLGEPAVWQSVGGKPAFPLVAEEAAALLARLRDTGLFTKVDARLDAGALELKLVENPLLKTVELRGLREVSPEEVIASLVQQPSRRDWATGDDEERPRSKWEKWKRGPYHRGRRRQDCPPAQVPRDLFARADGAAVKPGLLWGGLQQSLERLGRHLRSDGYVLASFSGSITSDGTLVLYLDEGHLEGFELLGVHRALREDVQSELGLAAGEVFSVGTLRSALARVRHRWPFLHADGSLRPRPIDLRVVVEDVSWGGSKFHLAPPDRSPPDDSKTRERARRSKWSLRYDRSWDFFDVVDSDDVPSRERDRRLRAVEVDGQRVRVHLRADRATLDSDWVELIRHTQVTGFAPGLPVTLRLWDPGDRVHLTLDGLLQINTRRAGRTVTGDFLSRIGASERVDWLAGAHFAIPDLQIAELGAQLHTLTDTPDRWRIGRLDSYLYSLVASRPESEYFRRSGVTAFATVHAAERFTLGAEYRLDRYGSLGSVKVPVIFNRDDQPYPNPAIADGLMGSMVFRAEWNSERIAPHKLGNAWRATETSLLSRSLDEPGARTLLTVEVADPSLGGDFKFVKLVSDSTLSFETGHRDELTFRVRVAGGHALPPQKQEALGGWTALRGYSFKEFRGDYSALGTLQWEWAHFGVFADVGAVKQAGGWTDPNLGVGALFHLDDVRFEAAWRTDQQAKVVPEMRLLFARTF